MVSKMMNVNPNSVSLDHVLAALDRQSKSKPSLTAVHLRLEFLDRIPNYDNRAMKYFNTYHPGDPLKDIFTVNEHLAALLSFLTNVLVLLVFVRVLGLARLPSRLIVSLSAVNLVSCLSLVLHTSAVSLQFLSNSKGMCRFVALFDHECYILFFYAMCGAIVERMIACNMPSYYSRALHIIGPAVIISPWAFWTLNIILMNFGVYEFDLGYECSSHTNSLLPDNSMSAGKRSATILACFLLCCLILSMILHNQNSGDVWEINRTQFELRTTRVVLKLAAVIAVFTLPDALAPLYRINGLTYQETRLMHMAWQLSIHKGLSLILVLLTRQEFRRHLFLVFETSENIRRTRTTNLLIAHVPTGRAQSSRLLRFSDSPMPKETETFKDDLTESTPSQQQLASSVPLPPAVQASTAIDKLGHSALVGRDKPQAIHTPEWLRKREPKQNVWSLLKVWNKSDVRSTSSYDGSDV
ncbi:hypothetical protein ElyMa_006774900 [Elysia marginata]|uniref:G-protein coupled receptors family 1 profile domain-containing protein n=1 Tax=Elysia marginata TaxID=1093978 RepID=A0AAV4IYU8_9GAST|nr:hypothetical protein ElyMa_006774900 [Elysia marginata]